MKVEIFSLCDFATVDAGSKMTLLGVFDTVLAASAPAAHGICALAVRIRFDKIEDGQKKIRISFVDSDGQPILPSMEAQIFVQTPPNRSSSTSHFVSIMTQLILPKFGEYEIDLAIDGRQEASTPLFFRQLILNQPELPTQSPSE
jgi:hypothetical protein